MLPGIPVPKFSRKFSVLRRVDGEKSRNTFNAGSSALVVPASVQVGNLAFLVIHRNAVAAPSGAWTLISSASDSSIYYKIMEAGDINQPAYTPGGSGGSANITFLDLGSYGLVAVKDAQGFSGVSGGTSQTIPASTDKYGFKLAVQIASTVPTPLSFDGGVRIYSVGNSAIFMARNINAGDSAVVATYDGTLSCLFSFNVEVSL